MLLFRITTLSLIFIVPVFVKAETITFYTDFNTDLVSEVAPLTVGLKKYETGTQIFGQARLEVGAKRGKWQAGILHRQHYQYDFNEDAADLYYSLSRSKRLDAGRTYHFDADIKRFRANGIRVARDFIDTDKLKVKAGVSYLDAYYLQDGTISGTAIADTEKEFRYDLNVDYQYEEDVLLDREISGKPKGQGYALDLQASWQATPRIQVDADIRDLLGQIRWKDAPYTVAVAPLQQEVVDENGFVQIKPTVSGREGYRDYKQKLPLDIKSQVSFSNQAQDKKALLAYRRLGEKDYLGIGASLDKSGRHYQVTYYPDLQVLNGEFQQGNLKFNVGADSISKSKAKSFWLGASWQKSF